MGRTLKTWIGSNWPKVAGIIVLVGIVFIVSHVACPADEPEPETVEIEATADE